MTWAFLGATRVHPGRILSQESIQWRRTLRTVDSSQLSWRPDSAHFGWAALETKRKRRLRSNERLRVFATARRTTGYLSYATCEATALFKIAHSSAVLTAFICFLCRKLFPVTSWVCHRETQRKRYAAVIDLFNESSHLHSDLFCYYAAALADDHFPKLICLNSLVLNKVHKLCEMSGRRQKQGARHETSHRPSYICATTRWTTSPGAVCASEIDSARSKLGRRRSARTRRIAWRKPGR